MKLSRVAIRPMKEVAPSFRVHHKVIMKRDTPVMSHRMGRCVSFQNMGKTSQLITAQRDEQREMAAISRVLKYVN